MGKYLDHDYFQKYYKSNSNKIKEQTKSNYQKLKKENPKIIEERQKKYNLSYHSSDKIKNQIKLSQRQRILKAKMKVFNHYTKGHIKCMCPGCDVDILEFLSLDHINNDGTKHRKEINRTDMSIWIVQNNFPDGFQILCMNCNWGKRISGICPHLKS